MAGAVMGFTKRQMEKRQDDILEFARIGEFVDQPVKVYSTGMFMRLAFSVAVHVDPDILLVDEALAVGDLIFQHRCIQRIRHLRSRGRTILFVSHDLQAVTQFCDRAILLERGRMLEDGSPERVVQRYQALVAARQAGQEGPRLQWSGAGEDDRLRIVRTVPHVHNRYGEGGARIMGVLLHSPGGRVLNRAQTGDEVHLLISVRFRKDLENPIVGFTVRDRMGVEITSSNTSYAGLDLPPARAGDVLTVDFRFPIPELRPGSYSISPAVARGQHLGTHRRGLDRQCLHSGLDQSGPGLRHDALGGHIPFSTLPGWRRLSGRMIAHVCLPGSERRHRQLEQRYLPGEAAGFDGAAGGGMGPGRGGRQRVPGRKRRSGPGKARSRTGGGRREPGLRRRGQPGNRSGLDALGPAVEPRHHPLRRLGQNPSSRGR